MKRILTIALLSASVSAFAADPAPAAGSEQKPVEQKAKKKAAKKGEEAKSADGAEKPAEATKTE